MKVSSLQAFLRSLVPALDAVGGNATLRKGVGSVADALQPFSEYDLEPFAAFLARAEVFDRTGQLPVVPAKARKPAGVKVDLSALTARLNELRALGQQGPSRREEVTREWAALALEGLKPADWLTVAQGLNTALPSQVKSAKDRARYVQRDVYRGFLPSTADLVQRVRAVEEQAAAPESTKAELEVKLDELNLEQYDAETLLEACKDLTKVPRKKTKEEAIKAIRQVVLQRKTVQRVNLV